MLVLFLGILFPAGNAKAQLVVTPSANANNLVQNVLIGQGVSAFNVTYTGATNAIGSFSNGWMTTLGLDEGIIMTTGDLTMAPPPGSAVTQFASQANGGGTNPLLAALIPGYTINDAAVLEFDFTPESDTIKFRYVFGSEEYPEWVGSSYNDVFGFFVSGPKPFPATGNYVNQNIALIPNTSLPVTIDNINNISSAYPQYYVDNQGLSGLTIVYDGYTVVLTAWLLVVPCQTYHITIAIGDAGDSSYDSAVFLEKGSFSSSAVEVAVSYNNPYLTIPFAVEGCQKAVISFNTPFPRFDTAWIYIDSIYGNAINGTDYIHIIDSVLIPPGGNAGSIVIEPIMDNIPEGIEYIYIDVQTSICSLSDTTLIIPVVDYNSIETVSTPDTLLCGEVLHLNTSPTGGAPPYNYIWSPQVGLNNPNTEDPVYTAATYDTVMFFVEISDSTNCSFSRDSMQVIFRPPPLISFAPDIFEGCDPLTVTFTENIWPNIQSVIWDFGDGQTSADTTPTHTFTYHPDSLSGYRVEVSVVTQEGCEASYGVDHMIKVFNNPKAEFYADPDSTDLKNPDIQFNNYSTTNVVSWSWNFGDSLSQENTSIFENPSHSYTEAGIYTITLEVRTEHGCWDTVSYQVKIVEELEDSLIFPNVFTPNGDGVNDYFVIDKLETEHYLGRDLIVFNRWGKKVYEASAYINQWDGAGLPDGTYFYIFRYDFTFLGLSFAKERSGSVTILR
jgi:gliding motility-associated-like protein